MVPVPCVVVKANRFVEGGPLRLEHLICVALERVQRRRGFASIPQVNRLEHNTAHVNDADAKQSTRACEGSYMATAGHQQELVERVEVQSVHLRVVVRLPRQARVSRQAQHTPRLPSTHTSTYESLGRAT